MKIYSVFMGVLLISACSKSSSPSSTTTSLRIKVTDSNDNLLSGASVKLFLTKADMNAGLNQIGNTATTDNSGSVLFDSLQPAVTYFFYASSGCMNNRLAVYPFKTFDSTLIPLVPSVENPIQTQVLPSGSIKYVNYSGNSYAISWTEQANKPISGGTFLTNLNTNDSITYTYEPVGEYKTKVVQLGGSYNNIRTDTLLCGDTLTIHLP